jgi:hypothetical protein
MSSTTHVAHFRFFGASGADRRAGARAGWLPLLRRLFEALIEPDQRRIDREMAAILARSGGRFTDAMEREAFQRQLSPNWRPL